MRFFKFFFFTLGIIFFISCNNANVNSSNAAYQDYINSPLTDIRPSVLPIKGNKDAKVQIAVFFDPWCPPCRTFEKELDMILADKKHYASAFGVNFYIFDLGHFPNDDEASLLHLEMSRRNLYTEFRDKVVSEDVSDYTKMLSIAEELAKTKLPLSLIKRNEPLLKEETKLVNEKEIKHTPTIFVNGKKLTDTPNASDLKDLIDYINHNSTK